MAMTILGSKWRGKEIRGPRYRKWAPKATYLPSARISDLCALRKELFLCSACERTLPWRWARRWEYWELPDYHGVGYCDGCSQYVRAGLWLPEEAERGYAQQWKTTQAIERAAIADNTIASRR